MKEKDFKKNIKKMVIKNLNTILNECKVTAKKWDKKTIPLVYLFELIKLSKIDNLPKELKQFSTDYNKMLDVLHLTYKKQCEKMESKSIPIELIKNYIDIVKEAFIKSLNNEK